MQRRKLIMLLGGAAVAAVLGAGVRAGARASGSPVITVYKEPT